MILKSFQVFLLFFIMSQKVWSGVCGLSITASNLTVTWDLNWTMQSVSITVNKTNPAACTFGLGFSKGIAGSYTRYANDSGKQIRYQIYQDSAKNKILKDVPDTSTTNDVIMVTLPPGSGPQVVQYFFDIPYALATTPFLAASGVYVDNLNINAYEGTDPSVFPVLADATAAVSITVNVDPMVAASLVDSGSTFLETSTTKSLDFGNLYQGQISRFDMLIRTNAGLSVTMASTNAGRLKHVTKNSYVPYSVAVNNVTSDLTGVIPVLTASGQTSMTGLGYPVKVVIGAITASSLSGNYQDSIVITATTTE